MTNQSVFGSGTRLVYDDNVVVYAVPVPVPQGLGKLCDFAVPLQEQHLAMTLEGSLVLAARSELVQRRL